MVLMQLPLLISDWKELQIVCFFSWYVFQQEAKHQASILIITNNSCGFLQKIHLRIIKLTENSCPQIFHELPRAERKSQERMKSVMNITHHYQISRGQRWQHHFHKSNKTNVSIQIFLALYNFKSDTICKDFVNLKHFEKILC